MANYPRSCVYLTSLLEGPECQGAATVWTDPGFLLCIKIYPARIQATWEDVTTQIYLGIHMVISRWNKEAGTSPARWLAYNCFTVCLVLITQSVIPEYVQHNVF